MALHIVEREIEGVTILDLDGDLTFSEGESEIRNKLETLPQTGHLRVILNLKGVGQIDSSGLGTLAFGLARLRKAGGNLVLLDLHKRNLELFVLTKLVTAFEVFDDEQEAVNSFFAGRESKGYDVLKFVQEMKAK